MDLPADGIGAALCLCPSCSCLRSAPHSAHMSFIRVGWLQRVDSTIRGDVSDTASLALASTFSTLPASATLNLTSVVFLSAPSHDKVATA